MYHSISTDLDDRVSPYFRTVTSPAMFARQVRTLKKSGFHAIGLSEALSLLKGGDAATTPGPRKVVITFDDGFRDFYTTAFPILADAGFTATVFLPSRFIGKPFITGRDCLSGAEIRELCGQGVEFGSHSESHRMLVELERSELERELSESKARIEDVTGRGVDLFSYPFRFPEENAGFTGMLGSLLDETGYQGGVTTSIGRSRRSDDIRFLPRLPMNDCDDEALLSAKLAGHYDWLRAGQRLHKRGRALWRRWRGA
jgi:peptidoglycan/xylan/chitin deacetylase (PgdA/CDA1 family)